MNNQLTIAKKNVENYKEFPNDNTLLVSQTHKQTCKDWLDLFEKIDIKWLKFKEYAMCNRKMKELNKVQELYEGEGI